MVPNLSPNRMFKGRFSELQILICNRYWFSIGNLSCFSHGQFDIAFSGVIDTFNDSLEQYPGRSVRTENTAIFLDRHSQSTDLAPQSLIMLGSPCTLGRPLSSSHLGLHSLSSWIGAQVSSNTLLLSLTVGLLPISQVSAQNYFFHKTLPNSPRIINFLHNRFSLRIIYFIYIYI